MIKKILSFLIIFSALASPVFAAETLTIQSGKAKHKFTIEIADDDLEREKGLMFRKELTKDRGMLFIFKFNNLQNFWMKNTLIPLDIIFIKQGGIISKVHKMAKPNDLTLISSDVPVVAALEIKGGEAQRRGIKAGDKVIYPLFRKSPLKPLPKPK